MSNNSSEFQKNSEVKLSDPNLWVDLYGDYLYRFARSRLRNDTIAQDLVQETFLAALQHQHKFIGNSSEKTWLTSILKNKVIDYFRRVVKENTVDPILPYEQEQLFENDEAEIPGHWRSGYSPSQWENTPQHDLEKKEFWEAFQRCHEKLSEKLAVLFSLREFDEMATAELCKVLDISESNMWVMLYRARMHLRRCLEHTWFGKVVQKGK